MTRTPIALALVVACCGLSACEESGGSAPGKDAPRNISEKSDVNGNALKHGSPDQLAAMRHLDQDLDASIGKYDDSSIHVRMRGGLGDDDVLSLVHDVNTLGNVNTLDLSETALTEKAAHHLASLKGVRQLFLGERVCTDAAMSHISRIESVEYISVCGPGITDIALSHLAKLPNLQRLQLLEVAVSDAGLKRFKDARPSVSVEGP